MNALPLPRTPVLHLTRDGGLDSITDDRDGPSPGFLLPSPPVRETDGDPEPPDLLANALAYARARDYRGWDYGDGMSSRLLQTLPIDNKWLNLAVQETIKRAPINLRPLFLVTQRRNFKGTALFAMANLNAYRLWGEDRYRDEAETLAAWLVEHQSDEVREFAGCHRHDLQGLAGRVPAGTPGVVGTAYGVQALRSVAEIADDRYRRIAHTASDFVVDRLDYHEVEAGARINYKPTDPDDHYTLNANALGARVLLDVYADRRNPELLAKATAILDYVVANQHPTGGWAYRDPPDASHLSMDNHHNGFIIETLQRYAALVDPDRYAAALDEALAFYRRTLFDDDGAPNWDETSTYPRDIHAAAQGILVFTYADDHDFARRIIDWTRDHLYAGNGRFYYRRYRWYTKRFTLMRWCQAWMAYALSEHLVARTAAVAEGEPETALSTTGCDPAGD